MSEILATSPPLEGEAPTVEGRLADIIEKAAFVEIDDYRLSGPDCRKLVAALRLAARAGPWHLDEHGRPYYFENNNGMIKMGYYSIESPYEWRYKEIQS